MGLVVNLVQTLSVVFIPLAAVLQPRVSELRGRGREAEVPLLLRRSMASFGLVAAPILAFLLLEAPAVFDAWVGRAVSREVVTELASTTRSMLLGQALYVLVLPLFYALLGVGEHRIFGLGMLAAGVGNAVLAWVATGIDPTIGGLGLAFSTTLVGLVLGVILPFSLRRFSLTVTEVAWRSALLPLLSVSPAALLQLRPHLDEPLLDLALAAVLFAAFALPGWLLARRRVFREIG
jgi:O-antigen/teichoic acid export membrane protein